MARSKRKPLGFADVALLAVAAGICLLQKRSAAKAKEDEPLNDPAFQRKMIRVSIVYRLAGIIYNE